MKTEQVIVDLPKYLVSYAEFKNWADEDPCISSSMEMYDGYLLSHIKLALHRDGIIEK